MVPRTHFDDDASGAELLSRIGAHPMPGPPLEVPARPLDDSGRSAQPSSSGSGDPVRSPAHRGHGRRPARVEPRAAWLARIAERTGVAPRAVLGLLVAGGVVVAVLALRLVLLQHQAQAVPLRMTSSSGETAAAAVASPSTTGPPGRSPAGVPTAGVAPVGTALVHVVGQVRRPGVVRLPAGARVEQALDAAGGPTSKADLVRVNLARPVVDGEQIVVPGRGEPIVGAAAAPGAAIATNGAGGPAAASSPVDLNTASLEQLDALPGVGPVLAQRILDWRSQNGRFSTVDELGEVSGIGDKVLERLRPLVRA